MQEDTMQEVWEAILNEYGGIALSALRLIALIPPDKLVAAINAIERETSFGPMRNPSAYLDGRRFRNADGYQDTLRAMLKLRATLERHDVSHPAAKATT